MALVVAVVEGRATTVEVVVARTGEVVAGAGAPSTPPPPQAAMPTMPAARVASNRASTQRGRPPRVPLARPEDLRRLSPGMPGERKSPSLLTC